MKSILRWTLRVVIAVVVLVICGVTAVYGASERRIRKTYTVPEHRVTVVADSASIARGQRIVTIRACVECHGPTLGGHIDVDNILIGRLSAPNLTKGGRGAELTDADWERAVRHGVRRDGSALLIMPAAEHNAMSDQDLADIIAYARSLPAAATVMPPSRAGVIVRAAYLAGKAPLVPAELIDHAKPHATTILPEPTAAYGEYFAPMCAGCHGPNFSGGPIPAGPPEWGPASNLTPKGLVLYKDPETFIAAMRSGRKPDGSPMKAPMPWQKFASMTDVELTAIYAYLQSLPPREYGSR